MTVRDKSLTTLRALGVANIFLDSYRVQRLPHNLDIFFGPPEEFFLAPETLNAYTAGVLIPLLDDGNFGVVTYYDPNAATFVQIDVESPDEPRYTYENWQQYLADLFIRIAEAGVEDHELGVIATLVKFKHSEATLSFLEAGGDSDWQARRARFIASLH